MNGEKLQQWYTAQEKLKQFKKIEKELREELLEDHFKGASPGTHRKKLGGGYELVATVKENVKIDSEASLQLAISELGEVDIKLVNNKYTLNKSGYNKLTAKQKKIFDKCLTVKPAAGELKVVANDA
jgi:hypothetical protein